MSLYKAHRLTERVTDLLTGWMFMIVCVSDEVTSCVSVNNWLTGWPVRYEWTADWMDDWLEYWKWLAIWMASWPTELTKRQTDRLTAEEIWRRSRWPRGLRCRYHCDGGLESRRRHGCLSLVRVVLLCRNLCEGPIPRPEESYRVCVSLNLIKCNNKPSTPTVSRKVRIRQKERKKARKNFGCWSNITEQQ
jgi:hypothetical protein